MLNRMYSGLKKSCRRSFVRLILLFLFQGLCVSTLYAQELYVASDLKIAGNFTVGGGLTIPGNYNIFGSSQTHKDFTVSGTTSLVGNAIARGTLDSTGDFAVNTNKFTVAASSGNTAAAGTLSVAGASTLTGNVLASKTVDVFGESYAHKDLTVTGSISSFGNLAVNTNKLTVAASSGNTAVAGTLDSAGNFSVSTNKFTVASSSGDTAVAGALSVTGLATLTGNAVIGSTRFINQKTVSTIGTSATNILTINFTNLAGSTNPLYKGAMVHLYVLAAGSVTFLVTPANSVNYYEGRVCVSPGATGGTSCTLAVVNEATTTLVGNGTTLTSSVSGTGTTAIVRLASSTSMGSPQSITIYYDVIGDNISSVS